ncbi:MAG TPA: CBS domain-containing protein [Gemmatimonadales bacterium]|nr:CBS domain-containing protein [Gemmatimonadales bacterium]
MPTVNEILAQKGGGVIALSPNDTVLAAAQLMSERDIGGIAIIAGGRLVGMFTERDVLRRVVARQLDPATTRLGAVMTSPVLCCEPGASIDECAALMTARHVRHLPVGSAEGLAGMISIRDLLAYQVRDQQATIQYMQNYIYDTR